MRNITVAVSDDSYRQARIWAAKNDTSVSAVVQISSSAQTGEEMEKVPTPPALSSQANETKYVTYKMTHFTSPNKALTRFALSALR